MVEVSLYINVECSECGAKLDAVQRLTGGEVEIDVDPCSTCIGRAHAAGYEMRDVEGD